MKTKSRFLELPQSGIRRMFDLAAGMDDKISFVLGEPDFVTPQHIRDAAIAKINEGLTHYTHNAGILPLREAIAESVARFDHVVYDPECEIMVTVGGMQAVYMAMLALLEPGDEVLIADPSYTNYVGEIVMNGGIPVPVPVYEKDGFNFTYEGLKEKVTEKTKAILLNSPCNPTGGVASEDTMKAVAAIAKEFDLYVVYDAVYKHLLYEGSYMNIAALPGMKERTIYIDSFSKTYAMTGWRLGYMTGPKDIISYLPKLQENMNSCIPEFVQYAGIEALQNGDEDIAYMKAQYTARREAIISRINSIDGLHCTPPAGAFYAFMNVKETGLSSVDFCEKLLEAEHVVTAPGSAFGEMGDGYVRLSYATSLDKIHAGMDRIEHFMAAIHLKQAGIYNE